MLGIAEKRHTVFHSQGKKPPLIWVSPGSVQHDVIRALGPDQKIYGLRMTKLDPSQPPMSFDEITNFHLTSLRSVQPHGPYILTGYCIASIIAREMACRLVEQGEEIAGLIMIDPPDAGLSRADLVRDSLPYKIRYNFHRARYHLRAMADQSFQQKMDYALGSFRALKMRLQLDSKRQLYKSRLNSKEPLPEEILDIHKNNIHAFMNHNPAPYPGFAYLLRPAVKPQGAFDYTNRRWAQLLAGGVEFRDVPGSSITMWPKPHALGLAEQLRSCLAQIHEAYQPQPEPPPVHAV